jgi:hypothetical protein
VHVHPEDGVTDVFRPYLACHDDVCITVVPRDRDVSNAQESGLDASWFAHEVTHRCRFSPRPDEPRLCTTWSDGENGGWFRQMHEGSGFFGHYFSPYMEHVRGGEFPIRPVGLSEYLAEHPPVAHAQVQTGAWNVGSTSGFDFSQWAGSPGQRRAGEALTALSRRWWSFSGRAAELPARALAELDRVRRQVLEGETSCYLFWGDDWLPQLDAIIESAQKRLDAIESLPAQSATSSEAKPGPSADRPPRNAGNGSRQGSTESPASAETDAPSPTAARPAQEPVKKISHDQADGDIELESADKVPPQNDGAGEGPTAVTKKTPARSRSPKGPGSRS